ncbi:glycoside hydrolase family 9 protein [Hygrophoropsis aurantiaca]|uniref:Glycoside hydrolase family 9 protein n=1 Tax=Hygrophoropsis aurantiaca TaxID=72124 RepID=A0ACB8AMB9_9AGAM|nr:glycoside hydrolase family 9 protein [Hygrophoropsis aurantiaca]
MWTLLVLASTALAQVPLPQPPFLPPNASSGATPSSSASVPNQQWTTLLGELLYFYDEQRSGTLPASNRVSWRNNSAVNDGSDVHLDLSGGFYDAGDYIKCTFPLSFTVMSICWGATDFGKGYDLANQTPYLDDTLRWALDWLIKAHSANNTLYVQIADANLDNAYWGGDQNIPQPRPSYQINATNPGTDAAAGTAAAFAACSNLYANRLFGSPFSGPATLQNATYAATLLQHAQQLYSFASSTPPTLYQNSVPQAGEAYASSGYGDELTLAALFLAWATNSTQAYNQAQSYWNQYSLAGYNGVFNWDTKTPAIPILAAQIANASPTTALGANLSAWQTEAERYLDGIVYGGGNGYLTRGGLLWYDGDSDDASANPALNAAMLLERYSHIASTPSRQSDYASFAHAQVDYVLGNNPMSAPYVVGTNPNAPQNPHSALAGGSTNITDPAPEAYVLYGGVVGGPDKYDRYFDLRPDWPEAEVALDYNAPMLTLAAMHVLNDTSDPFYTGLGPGAYDARKPSGEPCDAVYDGGCGGPLFFKGASIAMGVILGLVGALIGGLLAWWGWLVWPSRRGYRFGPGVDLY